MCRKLIILMILFWSPFLVLSQQGTDLVSVDAKTYELWLIKDWRKLAVEGRKAIDNGIDFYYLRYRLGIAYYELKDYHKALIHFRKAMNMNNEDEYLNEYLYYAYLYSGRQADAKLLANGFSEELKKKIGIGNSSFFEHLSLLYNHSFPANPEITEDFTISVDPQVSGWQYISKNHHLGYVSLQHNAGRRVSLIHAYTYIDKTYFIYSQNAGVGTVIPEYHTKLHQYYLAGQFHLANGLEMVTGVHYLNLRYPIEMQVIRQGQLFTLTKIAVNHDYVAFGSLYKKSSYFTLGGTVYLSWLNYARQLQKDLHLVVYPLGNLDLYAAADISHQTETYQAENRVACNFKGGVRFSGTLWLESYAGTGEMRNFMLNDGAIIFNSPEMIKQRYGLRVISLVSSHLQLSLDYFMLNNESNFVSTVPGEAVYNKINFKTHSISGGIRWNF